jgi:sugar-specific transcriptional regulator TrmB
MLTIDLTPFGFTPTESLVYSALLRLGPSTGYGVAGATRLARANTYAALEGLVTRGAAFRSTGRPVQYRPSDPQALLAKLAALQGEALDRLSRALRDSSQPGEPETRTVSGLRAVANVIQQLVARSERQVAGVIGAALWRPTLPAWRRAATRATLAVKLAGEVTETEGILTGTVPGTEPTILLIDDAQVITATGTGEEITALWSSHPHVLELARRALRSQA